MFEQLTILVYPLNQLVGSGRKVPDSRKKKIQRRMEKVFHFSEEDKVRTTNAIYDFYIKQKILTSRR